MAPPTLLYLCHQKLHHLAPQITDIGTLPPELVLPHILPYIRDPHQLKLLERNSPHLITIGALRGPWLAIIKDKIPNWEARLGEGWEEKYFCRENAGRWGKVYENLLRGVERERIEATRALKEKFSTDAKARPPVVEVRNPNLTSMGTRRRMGNVGGGPNILDDIRRQKKRVARAVPLVSRIGVGVDGKVGMEVSGRTKMVGTGSMTSGKVFQAPQSMIEQVRRERKREEENKRIQREIESEKKQARSGYGIGRVNGESATQREARLLALKSGSAAGKKTSAAQKAVADVAAIKGDSGLTEDFLESGDEDTGLDQDLFAEPAKKSVKPPDKVLNGRIVKKVSRPQTSLFAKKAG